MVRIPYLRWIPYIFITMLCLGTSLGAHCSPRAAEELGGLEQERVPFELLPQELRSHLSSFVIDGPLELVCFCQLFELYGGVNPQPLGVMRIRNVDELSRLATLISRTELRYLSSLDVRIKGFARKRQQEWFTDLTQVLTGLPHLRHCYLDLDDNPMNNMEAQALGAVLGALTEVERLEVFVERSTLGEIAARHFSEAFTRLIKLKELRLYAEGNDIGSRGARHLAGALTRMTELECLFLDLGKNAIGSAGVRHLAEALSGLTKLNYLEFDVPENQLGSEAAQYLETAVCSVRAPRRLSFTLDRNDIDRTACLRLKGAVLRAIRGSSASFGFIADHRDMPSDFQDGD